MSPFDNYFWRQLTSQDLCLMPQKGENPTTQCMEHHPNRLLQKNQKEKGKEKAE